MKFRYSSGIITTSRRMFALRQNSEPFSKAVKTRHPRTRSPHNGQLEHAVGFCRVPPLMPVLIITVKPHQRNRKVAPGCSLEWNRCEDSSSHITRCERLPACQDAVVTGRGATWMSVRRILVGFPLPSTPRVPPPLLPLRRSLVFIQKSILSWEQSL